MPTYCHPATAGWHLPMPPEEAYQRAVGEAHWDVAAWVLEHLPPPPPVACPSARCDAEGPQAATCQPPSSPPQPAVPALSLQHAVASGDLDQVLRLMDQPAVFSGLRGSELLALASYRGHVAVLRAGLAPLGAQLLLRTSDLWAGVEATAAGGSVAAAAELLGMLRAVPKRWVGRFGMSTTSGLRESAVKAGHREVAEVLAAAGV